MKKVTKKEVQKAFEILIRLRSEFDKAYSMPVTETPNARSVNHDKTLNYECMKEENEEYLDAVKDNDIVEVADAVGDEIYIALQKITSHGLQDKIPDVFFEIHQSNMSKLDPETNKAIKRADGKVVKGKNYFKPNLKQFFDA